jgi:hypothetical protein
MATKPKVTAATGNRTSAGYRGVVGPPKKRFAMLQAILLTSSLLLVLGMCASLFWLAAARVREAVPAQAPEQD